MKELLWAEWLKLRRTPLVWLSMLAALAGPALQVLLVLANDQVAWGYSVFVEQSALLTTCLVAPVLIALVGSFVVGREAVDGTLPDLMVVPVAGPALLVAKLVVVWLWGAGLMLWSGAASVAAALALDLPAAGHPGYWELASRYLTAAGLLFLTVPLIAWMTLLARSYIPPLVVVMVATAAGLLILHSDYGRYFPWTIAAWNLMASSEARGFVPLDGLSWSILIGMGVAGVALLLAYLQRAALD